MTGERRPLAAGFMLLLLLLLVAVGVHGQTGASGLIAALTQNLGVTEQQAEGGSGAIFQYAKGRLSPDEFSSLSSAVPGVGDLLAKAPAGGSGGTGGMLGQASSMLGGGASDSLGGLSSLAGPFASLGMSPDMVGKFVPTILDYVQSTGGTDAFTLLKGALPLSY